MRELDTKNTGGKLGLEGRKGREKREEKEEEEKNDSARHSLRPPSESVARSHVVMRLELAEKCLLEGGKEGEREGGEEEKTSSRRSSSSKRLTLSTRPFSRQLFCPEGLPLTRNEKGI